MAADWAWASALICRASPKPLGSPSLMSRSSGAPTPLSFGKAGRSLKRRKMRLPHSLAWQLPNSPELCSRTFPGCRDGLSQSNDSLDHQRLRSEEHTSELQSLMRISYAVFCLKTKKTHINTIN